MGAPRWPAKIRFSGHRWRILRAISVIGSVMVLLLIWANRSWHDHSLDQLLRFDAQHDINIGEKQNLCRQHGWKTWNGKRKVYDLFMANTELDFMEIRLNTTYDLVDYFVIVESPKTFTNLDKPMVIKENLLRFGAYSDKIIYHELEIPPGFHSNRANPAWDSEDLQRNAMYDQVLPRIKEGAAKPAYGDVIIVADVDELIRPETIALLKMCDYPRRLNLRSDFYYYSFQWKHIGEQWKHPQATYYHGWRTILPVNLRNSDGNLQPLVKLETADLWNAGWHCSSCFSTIEEMLTKMSSFSHISMNQPYFRDRNRIAERIRQGRDLWDREGEEFERIENNQDIPHMLLNEREKGKFEYMLNRDGPNAGFGDYP